jgi:hypothetical protein
MVTSYLSESNEILEACPCATTVSVIRETAGLSLDVALFTCQSLLPSVLNDRKIYRTDSARESVVQHSRLDADPFPGGLGAAHWAE